MKTTGTGPPSSQDMNWQEQDTNSQDEGSDLKRGPAPESKPGRDLATGADLQADLGMDLRSQAGPIGSVPSSTERANVFPFTPRRLSGQTSKNASRDPVRQLEDEQDRRRMQQNVAAAIIILLLVGAGFWLIDHLRTSARIAACIEAGHRNCVPLDLTETGARYR